MNPVAFFIEEIRITLGYIYYPMAFCSFAFLFLN